MSQSILVVQHAPHENAGVVGRILGARGLSLQLVRLYAGESLPGLNALRGMISLGGPMSANDEHLHPWIQSELELIRQVISTDRPFLGICLGAQLACRALGGRVTRLPTPEIGWHTVRRTPASSQDRLLGSLPATLEVYQWHYESFELPAGALHLLESESCVNQAWRLGSRAYGVQFHPEVDSALMEEWLTAEGSSQELFGAGERFGPGAVQSEAVQRRLGAAGARSNFLMAEALSSLFF